MPTCPGVIGTKSRTDRVAVSYTRRVTHARVAAAPRRHCDRRSRPVPRRPDHRPVKIGRLSACAALLLAASGSSPAKPRPSAAPSLEKPKRGMVYRNTPRPPALELPFIRILGERDASLRWPKADLRLDLIGAAPTV